MRHYKEKVALGDQSMCYWMVLNRETLQVFHYPTEELALAAVEDIHYFYGHGTMDLYTSPCPKALGNLTAYFIGKGYALNREAMQ